MDPITIALGLASVAPSIVRWIGGDDAGDVAQKVVSVAQNVAGVPDPIAAVQAIKSDPASQEAFRQAWLSHEVAMYQAETDRLKSDLADVASARSQTVELAKSGSAIAWGAPIVSATVLVTFGVVMYYCFNGKVDASAGQMLSIMTGALTTMATAVVSYWVGSNAGSARKDQLIAMAPSVIVPPPAKPRR